MVTRFLSGIYPAQALRNHGRPQERTFLALSSDGSVPTASPILFGQTGEQYGSPIRGTKYIQTIASLVQIA